MHHVHYIVSEHLDAMHALQGAQQAQDAQTNKADSVERLSRDVQLLQYGSRAAYMPAAATGAAPLCAFGSVKRSQSDVVSAAPPYF